MSAGGGGDTEPERGQSGTVVEALPNGIFRVALDDGTRIVAHVPARERMHLIRLIPGDRVLVALSPYDRTRGRVTGRAG
jgi:translation initiation factor IF-1